MIAAPTIWRETDAQLRTLPSRGVAGFTLIEMLVVLAIVGMMMTALPLVISGGQPGPRVKAAALRLAEELRALRAAAVVNHTETALALDLATGTYQELPDPAGRQLPKGMTARFVGPRTQILGEVVDIRFFPDGSSTGGKIGLSLEGIERWVVVQWLSGKVAVDG